MPTWSEYGGGGCQLVNIEIPQTRCSKSYSFQPIFILVKYTVSKYDEIGRWSLPWWTLEDVIILRKFMPCDSRPHLCPILDSNWVGGVLCWVATQNGSVLPSYMVTDINTKCGLF